MLPLVAVLLLVLGGTALPAGAEFPARSAGPDKLFGDDQQKKGSHQNDFLLIGTVFTEQGLSLPGAVIRVRRAGESKVRWEASSDRRGEFAVRVPRGAEYDMTVTARGYQEQTRKIDAKNGDRQELVFRMAPAQGDKKQ